MKKWWIIIPFLVIVFITIGYASFDNQLLIDDIAVQVRYKSDIRVTNVTLVDSASVTSTLLDYNISNISDTINLTNSTSYLIYKVEIKNVGEVNEGVLQVTGLPSGLTYEIVSYNNESAYQEGIGIISPGGTQNIYIKIKPTGSSYSGGLIANFDFRQIYTITYNDFSSVAGLPTRIMNGATVTATFTETTGVPTSVSVSGATGNYNDATAILTLTSATSNVTVTANSSTTVEVIVNEEDNSTTTITTTENDDGSTTTISVTEDENGNTTSETEAITNGDGSSSATTTNYDSSGSVTGSTTNYTDTSGNSTTQETTVVNGEEVVTGYAIDTSENGSGGVDITNSINTGIIAFDGSSPFNIKLGFYETLKNEGSYDRILSVIRYTNNRYTGFSLFYYVPTGRNKGNYYLRTQSFSNKQSLEGSQMSSSVANGTYADVSVNSYYQNRYYYYFEINYNGATSINVSYKICATEAACENVSTTQLSTITSQFTTLANAELTLGGNGINENDNADYMEVVEFSATKTVS